jgi:hypothetical protein
MFGKNELLVADWVTILKEINVAVFFKRLAAQHRSTKTLFNM